jgi:hypothetical protein
MPGSSYDENSFLSEKLIQFHGPFVACDGRDCRAPLFGIASSGQNVAPKETSNVVFKECHHHPMLQNLVHQISE